VIEVPLYVVVAQWALLCALGVLVIVLFRQLGRLLTGDGQAAGLGPPAGSRAAALAYTRPGEPEVRWVRPGDGTPLLLGFVDPTCPACEELVAALGAARAEGDLDGLRVLLLISDPPEYLAISGPFQSTAEEIGRPAARDGLDSYQVSGTPLLVAVDAAGIVRAAGSVVRLDQVRAFARQCREPEAAGDAGEPEAGRPGAVARGPGVAAIGSAGGAR